MDIITITEQIEENIILLAKARDELGKRADAKSQRIGDYDQAIAKTMIRLKNGQEVYMGDELVTWTSATGMEKIAKGICYQESINMDLAESAYRNAQIAMKAIETTINALQSILRVKE